MDDFKDYVVKCKACLARVKITRTSELELTMECEACKIIETFVAKVTTVCGGRRYNWKPEIKSPTT